MRKISDITTSNCSYETSYKATYKSDTAITTDEAEHLMTRCYRMFPVTRSSYSIDGDTMTINYTVDSCN